MKKLIGLISVALAMFSCGGGDAQKHDLKVVNAKINGFITEFDSIFVNNYDRPSLSVLADSILANIEIIRSENNQYDSLPYLYFVGGEVAMKVFKGEEALKFFDYLINEFPTHEQTDKAMYFVAYTYENVIQDTQKAIEMYKKLYKERPNSDWGENAKSQVLFLESQTPLMEDLDDNKQEGL
jgi:tetratricopeptide (TPR) repeat protein